MQEIKIEPAPHSFFYSDLDFKGFFSYVSSKIGKPADVLFSKHKELIKMLGEIPLATKHRIDLTSLPFHEIIHENQKCLYQGLLDEKKQPKGLGCIYNSTKFEFGVYNEAPFSVIKLKPELDQITIIPNIQQKVKTNLCMNGVVIKRYGDAYGRMTFPDGRYYEGGFEKDRDFGGVGMYLHSNGDHYHGEWKNSKKDGLGKWFVKS